MSDYPKQLGFDALLSETDADNKTRRFNRETVHLPDNMEEAIPIHEKQVKDHHAAMLANDFETALAIRAEAHLLAQKLNGNKHGIIAHDDAPGCMLAREVASTDGILPLWGQDGEFTLSAAGMRVSVAMHGMFGIGSTAMTFLGFEVRATDHDKAFLSATGYRSFLGASVRPELNMDVAAFVRRVIEYHVSNELKGKLVPIAEGYRKRKNLQKL